VYLVATQFKQWQEQDPEMAFAMGAIRALTEVIKASKGPLAFVSP